MNDTLTMRASDSDRQQIVDRLRAAVGDGRLTMDEYIDRMESAYRAVTLADLGPLCADLPAGAPTPAAAAAARASGRAAPAAPRSLTAGLPSVLKVFWTIWLTAVSINVVVWLLVTVTSGHLAYPWPLWVAGPFGAALFAISAPVTLFRLGRTTAPAAASGPVPPAVG
jgi:Domain of unknown function (DUF1707)